MVSAMFKMLFAIWSIRGRTKTLIYINISYSADHQDVLLSICHRCWGTPSSWHTEVIILLFNFLPPELLLQSMKFVVEHLRLVYWTFPFVLDVSFLAQERKIMIPQEKLTPTYNLFHCSIHNNFIFTTGNHSRTRPLKKWGQGTESRCCA